MCLRCDDPLNTLLSFLPHMCVQGGQVREEAVRRGVAGVHVPTVQEAID